MPASSEDMLKKVELIDRALTEAGLRIKFLEQVAKDKEKECEELRRELEIARIALEEERKRNA